MGTGGAWDGGYRRGRKKANGARRTSRSLDGIGLFDLNFLQFFLQPSRIDDRHGLRSVWGAGCGVRVWGEDSWAGRLLGVCLCLCLGKGGGRGGKGYSTGLLAEVRGDRRHVNVQGIYGRFSLFLCEVLPPRPTHDLIYRRLNRLEIRPAVPNLIDTELGHYSAFCFYRSSQASQARPNNTGK